MANPFKAKERNKPEWTPAEHHSRITKALTEGRTQQALELARALFKHESSAEHLDLVRKATLARARHLRESGKQGDAASMLTNAIDLGGSEFLKEVAFELVRAGATGTAQKLLASLGSPELNTGFLTQVADTAMRQGARDLLPEDVRPQFDLIRQAFAQAKAGDDEAARTSLQGVGLQSPFLEWKLLLRGLLAYYQNDDVRALENWSRLDSERLPFRLAAPLRFVIDPAFRQAQAPAAQIQLQKAADQLQGSMLAASLRGVQPLIVNEKKLPQAFRIVEGLLPALRQEAPNLVPRLAACFYWAIINHGNPEDKNRFVRVFGEPTDDAMLYRLEALALEERGDFESAHAAWKAFEEWLDFEASWGTPELRKRARALVWGHMGALAGRVADREMLPLPFAPEAGSLKPAAEQCFKKSLALAPDRLEGHSNLFDYYCDREDKKKALKAGAALLERFPDHVPTLEAMAELWRQEGKHAESVRLLEHALQVNPLERKLRASLAIAHMFHGRSLVEGKQFDAARAAYQTALTLEEPQGKPGVLCRWAAGEFKAKNDARAEELLQQAHAEGGSRAYVAFYMAIEVGRLKLPPAVKRRFGAEFTATLEPPPGIATALELLDLAVSHELSDVSYPGWKAHQKKVLTYVETALALSWTEEELERLCTGLALIKAAKLLKKVIRKGKAQYPKSPVFPLKNALLLLNLGPARARIWEIRNSLRDAEQLVEGLPEGDRRTRLLHETHELEKVVQGFVPLSGPSFEDLNEMMDAFFGD